MSRPSICHVILFALICATLGGCYPQPTSDVSQAILEPPLIPEPPPPVEMQTADMPTVDVQVYADLLEWQDDRRYPADLQTAVTHAISLGILKPVSFQERFEPGQAITYGEFRRWALAYQTTLYGYQALPTAKTLATVQTEIKRSTPHPQADLTGPMSPEKLFILPEKLEAASGSFDPSSLLTREALCHLFFLLTHQGDKLRMLSPSEIEAMTPYGTGDPGDSSDESLSQFKDYSAISAWARPAVALFYQSGRLQKLFGKSPNQLTIDDGFSPNQPATRADAIVLLHWIYGGVTPNRPVTAPASTAFSGPLQPRATIRVPGGQENQKNTGLPPTIPPQPLGKLKWPEHQTPGKTPHGKHSSLQINGPD